MYMCMDIYIICMYACMYVYTHMCVYIYTYVYTYMCVYTYIRMSEDGMGGLIRM